jgi:hypothetical protein
MQKGFFIYGVVAGAIFILAALYVLIFGPSVLIGFALWKIYTMGIVMLAYGAFRIWRAYKMKQ